MTDEDPGHHLAATTTHVAHLNDVARLGLSEVSDIPKHCLRPRRAALANGLGLARGDRQFWRLCIHTDVHRRFASHHHPGELDGRRDLPALDRRVGIAAVQPRSALRLRHEDAQCFLSAKKVAERFAFFLLERVRGDLELRDTSRDPRFTELVVFGLLLFNPELRLS